MSSAGQEAIELAASAGLHLDPWQRLFLDDSLGERADGTWSAFEVGLVVSRQNGKGSCIEARELAGLFVFGERVIIHSAHLFDTSMEAMNRLLELIESTPDLDKEVKRTTRSHGEEGIELKSGQRIRFKTRTKGGGRGLSADLVIIDEAMYLPSATVAALLPTMSARPNPQVWYTGSAGDNDSVQLGRVRNRGLEGLDDRLCYLEWSIDGCTIMCPRDCDEHDPPDTVDSYAKANPGLGIRMSVEHIESERRSMDPEDFARERLGVGDWPVEGDAWRIIAKDHWTALIDTASEPAPESPLAFSIAVSRDAAYAAIGLAGYRPDDLLHVELAGDQQQLDYRPGTGWVVQRMKALVNEWGPCAVVVDAGGPGGFLIPRLEAVGVDVISPSTREYAQACGSLYNSVTPRKGNTPDLRHLDQRPLTTAVSAVDKRKLAELWAWARQAGSDISPLEAVTLAAWGLAKKANDGPKVSPPWVMFGR